MHAYKIYFILLIDFLSRCTPVAFYLLPCRALCGSHYLCHMLAVFAKRNVNFDSLSHGMEMFLRCEPLPWAKIIFHPSSHEALNSATRFRVTLVLYSM